MYIESKAEIPLGKITAMFASAKVHLKYPKIRLQSEGKEIVISPAPMTGNNPGALYVKVSNEYAGKITKEGKWLARERGSLETLLLNFAADPKGEAIKYGKLTGNCCFCARTLTADNSLETGYGPICAARYGLPHGG